MITMRDYFMGRDVTHAVELTEELQTNAAETVRRVNALFVAFGEERGVRSGWRPRGINANTPGAAVNSKHMTCQACDLMDDDGDLDEWALDNPQVLVDIGLWQEHPSATKGWAHFQIVPPKSGKRVFYP